MLKEVGIISLVMLFLLPGIATCFALQDEEKPKPETASVQEAIANFEKALEEMDKDKISPAGEDLGKWSLQKGIRDGDKKKMVSCVERGLYTKKDPEYHIRMACAYALAKLPKKYATPAFLKVFKNKQVKDNIDLMCIFIGAMGSMADQSSKATKFFCALLKNKDNIVIAKTAEAMAYYSRAKSSVRKNLVKELINALEGPVNQSSDPKNSSAKRKVAFIQQPILQTLQELTGERVGSIMEWRRWYNKNKKKKWVL